MGKIVIILVSMLYLLTACVVPEITLQKSYGEAMGTSLMLAYYSPVPRPDLLEKAEEILGRLESEMTIWDRPEPSEMMKLNIASGKESILLPPDSAQVLRTALKYAGLTGGAFDPTVGNLVKAWGVATDNPRVPSREEIQKGLDLAGWKLVQDTPEGFYLPKEGMVLDLGAIAKGYAADRLRELFLEEGLNSGIIDLGGNLFLLGQKADGSLWKVGVQDPFLPRGNYLGILPVRDKSLVTSGIYERNFEVDGKSYHHILDPATGWPADNELAGVTIVHNPSVEADALSTAVFVMGLPRGWDFILSQPEAEAVFVTRDRKIYLTPGLKDIFTLTGDYELMTGAPGQNRGEGTTSGL